MIVLTGGACPGLRECILQRQAQGKNDIGFLFTMRSYRTARVGCSTPLALDNDMFGAYLKGDALWWKREGEPGWRKMLDKIPDGRELLFALLPDVVANWPQTLERGHLYRPELSERKLPIALALQDGCDFEAAWELRPDWVFVGGTTHWKWTQLPAIVAFFHARGVKVHVGRAGGRSRIRECLRLGVDCCDSTGFSRFWDTDMNWLPDELDACDRRKCFDQLYLL